MFIEHLEDLLNVARRMLFAGCDSPHEYELSAGEILALEYLINNDGDDPLPPDDERMGRYERLYRFWVDRCDRFEIAYRATGGQPFGIPAAPAIANAAREAIYSFRDDAREDWILDAASREEIRRDEASLDAARAEEEALMEAASLEGCLQAIDDVRIRPGRLEEPFGE